MQEKRYNDYLEEFKENMKRWVEWHNFSYKEAFEGIKDYLVLVPFDYRDDLYKDLEKWSMENG